MSRQSRSLYILCARVFPLMVCTGIVYSVLPLYISGELGASPSQIGLIYMVGASMGAIFAPYLGRLGDRWGRQRVLGMAMAGFAVAFSLYSLLRRFPQALPIQALEGASWAALGATAPALVADLVPREERGWAMGIYERTWSLGWIVGPVTGGFLAENLGFRPTFLVGAALVALGALSLLLGDRKRKGPGGEA